MIADGKYTVKLWETFNLNYRKLFPKEWTIRLYAQAFFRAEVIPDTGKPLRFVLGLGHDREFYERAAKSFKEQTIKSESHLQHLPKKPQEAPG